MGFRVIGIVLALLTATAATAQTDYRLRPGDQLRVEVLEDSTLNREVLVLPDGSISFPLAGAVTAGGSTTTDVAAALARALAPNFATAPNVSVSVSALGTPSASSGGSTRTIDVFLMGEVNGPGRIEVKRGTTLLQALALSGGFTKFAATKRVQLRRTDAKTGEQTVYVINYRAVENGESNVGNSVLADGDVIIVPERRLFE